MEAGIDLAALAAHRRGDVVAVLQIAGVDEIDRGFDQPLVRFRWRRLCRGRVVHAVPSAISARRSGCLIVTAWLSSTPISPAFFSLENWRDTVSMVRPR